MYSVEIQISYYIRLRVLWEKICLTRWEYVTDKYGKLSEFAQLNRPYWNWFHVWAARLAQTQAPVRQALNHQFSNSHSAGAKRVDFYMNVAVSRHQRFNSRFLNVLVWHRFQVDDWTCVPLFFISQTSTVICVRSISSSFCPKKKITMHAMAALIDPLLQ